MGSSTALFQEVIVERMHQNNSTAYFAVCTLVFGGPRGCEELANLSIRNLKIPDYKLLFCSVGYHQNQTGCDTNFNVRIKPDLYF